MLTSGENLPTPHLGHFDISVRKALQELCRMFKETDSIIIMVQ